jgi:NAD(P)-dependent dehydrogenase (short-subunit alcohol dehydrogenase family)
MSPSSKTIVITGCSSGFGRATARHLARQGWRVFATVRKHGDREGLLAEAAAQEAAERLTPVICDITQAEDVRNLARIVAAETPQLNALLNNAGTAYPGPLELLPLDDLRAQFELNVIAQMGVTQALLPLLKAGRGTIINVSSIGGRIASVINGPYCASKFAFEALSDTLRLEVAPFGVRVVVIEPGASPTSIWETGRKRGLAGLARREGGAGDYAPLVAAVEKFYARSAARGFPPERFAETVAEILGSLHPRTRYTIPRRVTWVIHLRRLAPDWLWDWGVRRALKW